MEEERFFQNTIISRINKNYLDIELNKKRRDTKLIARRFEDIFVLIFKWKHNNSQRSLASCLCFSKETGKVELMMMVKYFRRFDSLIGQGLLFFF